MSRPRIALDLRLRTPGGVSNYIRHLLPHVLAKGRGNDFVAVKLRGQEVPEADGLEAITCPVRSMPAVIAWEQALLPTLLRKTRADLYHTLKLPGPYNAPCPVIRTAHSITSSFRGTFPVSRRQRAYWITLGNHIFRNSTAMVAVSDYVRDFLLEELGYPAERVAIVSPGIDISRFATDGSGAPTAGCERPFILAVGNVHPVKNHLTAVRAFAAIAGQFPRHQLVIAGGTGHPYAAEVRAAIAAAGLAERVRLTGFLPSASLAGLYRSADLLVMPSTTEGWPLALVEAMACGLQVVGTNTGGIAEVGGSDIVLVDDPHDVPAWAAAIARTLSNLGAHEPMRQRAMARARSWTWGAAADRLLRLYDAVLAQRPAEVSLA